MQKPGKLTPEEAENEVDDDDDEAEDLDLNHDALPVWKREDIEIFESPIHVHDPPIETKRPHEYFLKFFNEELVKKITYETNLYARQQCISTKFSTDEEEILKFMGILMYMGVSSLPSIGDYWSTCLLYTSPSPRDKRQSRMPSSA